MLNPDFSKNELIPAIVQNADTGRVLMLAYMNEDAFSLTKSTGLCHFWSRSRNEIWKKGETSGNTLNVVAMEIDCDADSILVFAKPAGPCCHNGTESCFDTHRIEANTEVVDYD
jgi:phosphoribosyl-ATP pyrophosphohydrolase/phosphoribosyl-AMP cyclohydrolase